MEAFGLSRLICCIEPRPDARCRLLCFAHAGGGATVFARWHRLLPETIEVCAVQLPGRESRHREPFIVDFSRLMAGLVEGLRPLHDRPVVLFGHSLGGLIAFEYARRLEREGVRALEHVIVSGCRTPGRPTGAPLSDLPHAEFLQAMTSRYNGIPQAILAEPDMLEYVLPIMRADMKLLESYRHEPGPPLAAPLAALGGTDDPGVTPAELERWRAHASGTFRTRTFPGGHFFISESQDAVLAEVTSLVPLTREVVDI